MTLTGHFYFMNGRSPEGIQHQERIASFNGAIKAHLARRGDRLEGAHTRRVEALRRGIETQIALVAHPDVQSAITDIATRYAAIDAVGHSSPLERLALCLRAQPNQDTPFFAGIHVVSDFDKSMSRTEKPTDSERTYLMPNMPGSVPLEAHMDVHGRDSLVDGFVRNIQRPLRGYPHLFREGGKHAIQWRDGALELFGKLRALDIKRTILSANVEEFIKGALGETHLADDAGLEIRAMRYNDISSTDKATAIQLLAAKHSRFATIYIGDGASDMKIVEAYKKGVIGAIFALKDCEFEKQLIAEGIPHIAYSNFHEIDSHLQNAGCFTKAIQQKAA